MTAGRRPPEPVACLDHMASSLYPSHDRKPALPGWSTFVGMAWVDAAAALTTNQPRGY
jgi:hypothetical protein